MINSAWQLLPKTSTDQHNIKPQGKLSKVGGHMTHKKNITVYKHKNSPKLAVLKFNNTRVLILSETSALFCAGQASIRYFSSRFPIYYCMYTTNEQCIWQHKRAAWITTGQESVHISYIHEDIAVLKWQSQTSISQACSSLWGKIGFIKSGQIVENS